MNDIAVTNAPNILITGTPGTGKTCLSEAVAHRSGLKHINVGELVRTKGLHDEYIEEYDTHALNEEKLLDELEDTMNNGGVILDFHSSAFFPERWFQLVIILRTSNDILYPRLEKRNYSTKKIQENIEAEIMQVCRDEAVESYDANIIVELQSNTIEDMNHNLERVVQWITNYNNSNNNIIQT